MPEVTFHSSLRIATQERWIIVVIIVNHGPDQLFRSVFSFHSGSDPQSLPGVKNDNEGEDNRSLTRSHRRTMSSTADEQV